MKYKELWRNSIQECLIRAIMDERSFSDELKLLVIDELRTIKASHNID